MLPPCLQNYASLPRGPAGERNALRLESLLARPCLRRSEYGSVGSHCAKSGEEQPAREMSAAAEVMVALGSALAVPPGEPAREETRMGFQFSRIAVPGPTRRVRLVGVALLIATLGVVSRALPTSADLPYTIVYGTNGSIPAVTAFEVGCPMGVCYGTSFAPTAQFSAPVAIMPAPGTSVSIPLQFVQQTAYPVTVIRPTTVTGPIVSASTSSPTGTATDIAPDSCWNYDSWCAYCTFHSSPECTSYPPGKRPASTGAASSTPGVGSPSAAPSGGAPASGGGGGPAYP